MKTWQKATIAAGVIGAIGTIGAIVYLRGHSGYERLLPIEPNDVVLDVGAGGPELFRLKYFTISAAEKVGQGGLVISVEPCPKNVSALREEVVGLNNVIIVQKAAWIHRSSLPLCISPSPSSHTLIGGRPTIETITVEADTLDNIVSELGIGRVDFIKMDIEGAEVEALIGAEQVLSTARKVVIAAYHTNRQDISPTHPWVTEFLRARGFQTRTTWPGLVHAWR